METERIELSARERERLKVLQQVEEGHLQQVEAARRLRVSDRQVRRWQQRLRKEGDRGIVHRLRGRRSNRKIPEAMRKRCDNGTTTGVICRCSRVRPRRDPQVLPAYGLQALRIAHPNPKFTTKPNTFRLPITPGASPWKRTFLNCNKPDISTLR